MQASGVFEKVTMDNSGAYRRPWMRSMTEATLIIARQIKYLNNIVEQDHRAVKRVTKSMLNFKSFRAAKNVLAGIEFMHMTHKAQILLQDCIKLSIADQFYALAGKNRRV
jgi:transposase-like protein